MKIGIVNHIIVRHERTIRARKNIIASFLIKGLSIVIGLILVPLTIDYLNPIKYGIWITLSSIIGWFSFFDIGLGNGLRNKFAEAIAKGDNRLARIYVSTTYAIITTLIISIIIFFSFLNSLINWNKILNINNNIIQEKELNLLALIVFIFFWIRFVLKLISTILIADQRPAWASFIELINRIIILIIIFILTKTTKGSLLHLGTAMSVAPIIVLFFFSILFFQTRYRIYRPSFRFVHLKYANELIKLGFKFFFIQIAMVLLYQTNNLIISHLFGPAEVTPYNIAFKYFNILLMGFSIIVTPFWSAITDAWIKKDIYWIKASINQLIRIWFILLLLAFLMVIFSSYIYDIWIGRNITIVFSLSIIVCISVLVNTWNSIFSKFLNGIGKINLQMYLGALGAILNIPLAIFLGKHIGITGVILANIIVVLPGAVFYPIQYKKLIHNKAYGIYEK